MLDHGGRLHAAARRYDIAIENWLDLSTGIAPWAYPLPAPPIEVWQRLPEEDDDLEAIARLYYGAPALATPGSQWALETLPRLLPPGRVAMPSPIYAEHPAAWQAAGHEVVAWEAESEYALLCRPNNPTGEHLARESLLARAARVQLFVVDEAFIDATPDETLAGAAESLVVLRSLGKFFGLAGARIGFVCAASPLLDRLRERLSPWAVSHPARWAARIALADRGWHAAQRRRLQEASARLAEILRPLGRPRGCAFFQYLETPHAAALQEAFARRAILVRRFADPPALRIGLPADAAQWRRLAAAIQELA